MPSVLMLCVIMLSVLVLDVLMLGVIMLSVVASPRSSGRLNFTGEMGDLCHIHTNQQVFEPTMAVSLV
jgi:hypothetical protein